MLVEWQPEWKGRAAEIRSLLGRTVIDGIEIGRLLADTKEQLGHGKFTRWIEEELPISQRTARNYMLIYRQREKIKNITGLLTAYNEAGQIESAEKKKDNQNGNNCRFESKPVVDLTHFRHFRACGNSKSPKFAGNFEV